MAQSANNPGLTQFLSDVKTITEKSPCAPRRPIPSGAFVVASAREEVLEAYLGTCLGVTLCDPEAKVGGLIHLLLLAAIVLGYVAVSRSRADGEQRRIAARHQDDQFGGRKSYRIGGAP